MGLALKRQEGEEALPLYPITFRPGCNNDPLVIREQLKQNIQLNIEWLDLVDKHERVLSIVGGGPSLSAHIQDLLTTDSDILALNGSYDHLLAYGIKPDYFMLLDTREGNISFLDNACDTTKHFIAAQCHPSIFNRLEGLDTVIYLTTLPDVLSMVSHIDKPKHRLVGTAGTVGIKALSLAYALGYRKLRLYGYDSSYADGAHHAFPQALNDASDTMTVLLNDKEYITTPSMAHQAVEFLSMAHDMVHFHEFDIELHGSGLLYDMVKEGNARGDIPLETREREKYERIWQFEKYRRIAPGERHVDKAIEYFKEKYVIDFGCGSGRSAQALEDKGYFVLGIDHVANCRDENQTFRFTQACLWDLPKLFSDWGFCTDVMEHIPTEKVPAVLNGIYQSCKWGVYFNISTRPDFMGAHIGEKLHLTVMESEEWAKLLKQYWPIVELIEDIEGEASFIVRKEMQC